MNHKGKKIYVFVIFIYHIVSYPHESWVVCVGGAELLKLFTLYDVKINIPLPLPKWVRKVLIKTLYCTGSFENE